MHNPVIRRSCVILPLVLSTKIQTKRPHFNGNLIVLHSGKRRVGGLVKAVTPARANQSFTGIDGSFFLLLQDITPKQNACIRAKKKDWPEVNDKELNTGIPATHDAIQFQTIICTAKSLEQARKTYYEITDRHIPQQYKKHLSIIDRAKNGWQARTETLNEQFNVMRKQISEIDKTHSRSNINKLPPAEKLAIEQFKAGNIEIGIQLRETLQTSIKHQIAMRRSGELDSLTTGHNSNLETLDQEDLLVFDFSSAGRASQQLAIADTSNALNVFAVALFLQKHLNQTSLAIDIFRQHNNKYTQLYGCDFRNATLEICECYNNTPLDQFADIKNTILKEVDRVTQLMSASPE